MPPHNLKIVPCLDQAMRLAQATNLTLQEVSGVNHKTIQKARTAQAIRPYLADTLMQSLCTCSFVYEKPGPKRRNF